MSLRSSALKIANRLRGLAPSPAIDIYTTRVIVRTRTWTGGRIGADGGKVDEDLEILPRPRVREISQREIAGPGGRYQAGDVRVGPITPKHAGGGYTQEQLAPAVTQNGVEVIYVLEGGISGEYMRVDLESDRAFRYMLILRRKRSSP